VLKYAQRFRDRASTPERMEEFAPKNILLNVTESGHGGEIGTQYGIKEKAFYFGFLEHALFKANKEIKIKNKLSLFA